MERCELLHFCKCLYSQLTFWLGIEFQVGNEVLFLHKQEGPAPLLSGSFGIEMFEATFDSSSLCGNCSLSGGF